MGQFSFQCSACGEHEQFDWTDAVVVALKHIQSGEILHVRGHYGSYGDVYVDLCNGSPSEYDAEKGKLTVASASDPVGSMPVNHKQFEDLFDCWSHHDHHHVAAEEIFCFGHFSRWVTKPKKDVKNKQQPQRRGTNVRRDEREEYDCRERDDREVSDDEEEEVQERGCRMCVPSGKIIYGQLPLQFAEGLPKWTESGVYEPLGKADLEAMTGPPGARGMDAGCIVM